MQIGHNNARNPNIAHANKVMSAIADCTKAVKDTEASRGAPKMSKLEQLPTLTKQSICNNLLILQAVARTDTQPFPRVQSPPRVVPRVQLLPRVAPGLDGTTACKSPPWQEEQHLTHE